MDWRGTAWAHSGAMALTGRTDGPALGAPGELIELVGHTTSVLRGCGAGLAMLDGPALLGERAALSRLTRKGSVSCGGGTRLLRASDGWVAVSLARDADRDALSAWVQADIPVQDPWAPLTQEVARRQVSDLDGRAALLGLPIAALGSVPAPRDTGLGLPISATPVDGRDGAPRAIGEMHVVDLSSLWAGPLCGHLLALAGATVTKVESTHRPDGARRDPSPFFDLLNGPKRSVALDLRTAPGAGDLGRIIQTADVVIESARPRALEQLGLHAGAFLRQAPGPTVWVSITSHGLGPGNRDRVGFGDVAAVAGGLVAWDPDGPCFLADAVADPLAGMVAAAAVTRALATGHGWLLDVAMAPLAASVAGQALAVEGLRPRAPRARPVERAAPPLGAHTAAVVSLLAS
jgi:hypothetical protein